MIYSAKRKEELWKELKKQKKNAKKEDYSWCSTLKKWLPKTCFYTNSSKPNGLQTECKLVIQSREYGRSTSDILESMSKRERARYA